MKYQILITLALLIISNFETQAQGNVIISQDIPVITTGVPFLLIAPDARAAAMGDMGVATSTDGFSQQWNSSKYVFSTSKSGISVSYTPYLSKLVNDIFLGNVTYFNKINQQNAVGASLKYFSLGDIEFVQDEFSEALLQRPNEFTLDLSYGLRLSDQFAMSVALRFLNSDLKLNVQDTDAKAASTFGVDINGFYKTQEKAYNSFNGRWRGGFAIQNIGPKFKYDEGGQDNFQPTNLRLGAGFDFVFDDFNKLALTLETTKLLVPTPPIIGFVDTDGNGRQGSDEPSYIVSGQDNDVGFVKGIFQSFGDAPGGGSEELKEFTAALGAEYLYQDSFAFRLGYFNEHETKGARKFFALGAGFKYNVVNIDLSYLFSASKVQSPLESTLRFSLTFNLGEGEYEEY